MVSTSRIQKKAERYWLISIRWWIILKKTERNKHCAVSRIFVTGMGAISAIGNNVPENRESLRSARAGIGHLQWFNTKYASLLPFAEIKKSNDTLRQTLQVTDSGVTRTSLLALHAFDEAVADAKLTSADLTS